MGEQTAIGWTDHTFNPWWGCERVSPACQHCYAEAFAKRTGSNVWGKTADRRFFGDKHWNEPLRWDRAAAKSGRPALVFCASMADVFEDRPDLDEHRARLWKLIDDTPHLIWQLLTKRPENVLTMTTWSEFPRNVWIGTTVEDQRRADERIPVLRSIPAAVRFLSCEPLLGPLDLSHHLGGIGWVIVGGESGAGHRPLDLDHARDVRDHAHAAGVPFFFKQVGGHRPTSGGDLLDGETFKQFPPRVGLVKNDAEQLRMVET